MEKYVIALAVISMVAVGGCGHTSNATQSPIGQTAPANGAKPPNQSITTNKVNFEKLNELPKGVKGLQEKGFRVTETSDSYIVVISSGQKPSLGYSIEVNGIEDNEGKTIIAVQETGPKQGEISGSAITFPSTIIKIAKNISPVFVVAAPDRTKFPQLQ